MLDSFRILVLNYSFEPLQFCNARKALIMVMSGRAEQVEYDGYMVRSPSRTFPLPTVVRVLKMVKRRTRKNISFSKKNILRRDNYTCQYCGVKDQVLTVDHIIPKSRGGTTTWTNVVVACKPCNLNKGNQTAIEAGMELFKKPSKPEYYLYPLIVPSAPPSHLESWLKYLPSKVYSQSARN